MVDPFVCPRGHHNVKLKTNRFECGTCRKYHPRPWNWDIEELVDLRVDDPPEQTGTGRVLEEP